MPDKFPADESSKQPLSRDRWLVWPHHDSFVHAYTSATFTTDAERYAVFSKQSVPFGVIQFIMAFLDGALLYMVHYSSEVKGQQRVWCYIGFLSAYLFISCMYLGCLLSKIHFFV